MYESHRKEPSIGILQAIIGGLLKAVKATLPSASIPNFKRMDDFCHLFIIVFSPPGPSQSKTQEWL